MANDDGRGSRWVGEGGGANSCFLSEVVFNKKKKTFSFACQHKFHWLMKVKLRGPGREREMHKTFALPPEIGWNKKVVIPVIQKFVKFLFLSVYYSPVSVSRLSSSTVGAALRYKSLSDIISSAVVLPSQLAYCSLVCCSTRDDENRRSGV